MCLLISIFEFNVVVGKKNMKKQKRCFDVKLQDLMNQLSDWESNWPKWVHNKHGEIEFHMLHVTIRYLNVSKKRKRYVTCCNVPHVLSIWVSFHRCVFRYGTYTVYTSECFQETTCFFFRSCWLCDAPRAKHMTFVWECLNAMSSLTWCWLEFVLPELQPWCCEKIVSSVKSN